MSRSITQYRVFIATPGGLDDERQAFRKTLEAYSASDALPRGVRFHPVGWADTLGGIGRPQDLINEDLRQCDYAVFVWHDRWGSPTGNGTMVGTEEELNLAEELNKTEQVRNIAVFFKNVDQRKLQDPDEQLKEVLAHKKRMEKRYLFKSYDRLDEFCEELRKHLAQWLRDHEKRARDTAITGLVRAYGSMEATEGTDVAMFSGTVGSDLTTADAPSLPSVDIKSIVADDFITGTTTNLPPGYVGKACVVVFVHTDIWHIHPYAKQGAGKSFARIDSNGNWSLPTVQRDFVADQVAALVMKNDDDCDSVPVRIGNISNVQFTLAKKIIDLKSEKREWYRLL